MRAPLLLEMQSRMLHHEARPDVRGHPHHEGVVVGNIILFTGREPSGAGSQPAAAAAAAARAFTVFGDDDEEDDAECCRPRSAPSTPPAESSFLGEDQGKEREREKRETRRGEERERELLSFHLPSSPPPASQSTQTKQTDFAPSPPSLDDALASLELCADRASEGEGGDDEERNSNNVGEREGGGGASAWAVSPPRDASAE